MKLVKESVVKKYRDNNECLVEEIKQYHFDNEEERARYVTKMQRLGYSDSGQVMENVGTFENPVYKVFASFYRYTVRSGGESK